MKTFKKFTLAVISLIWVFVLSSCSTTSTLPYDDVYYTPQGNSASQQTAALSDDIYTSSTSTGDYQSYYNGGESQVSGGNVSDGEYYSEGSGSGEDIYYDSDYESRIKRFNNEGSSLGYYDDYYTNSGCNCGSSSNWNVSIGFGFGYGYGYYGWGYPYYGWGYPYYGWGYPYWGWGYPYYGWGGSYWNGYNNGYWNGYWDGYYGNGYWGGDYYTGVNYGPRGSRGGGTTVPRTGSRGGTDRENPAYREKTVVAGGGAIGSRGSGGSVVSGSGTQQQKSRPAESVRINQDKTSAKTDIKSRDNIAKQETDSRVTKQRNDNTVMQKPANKATVQTRENPSKTTVRYTKPTGSTNTRETQLKYDKPKSYRSLPSQKPRSENKYVAPKRNSQTSTTSRSKVQNNTRNTVNQPTRNYKRTTTRSGGSSVKSNTSGRSTSTTPSRTTRSSSPSRSYSTPSRSYSSPSRSSGSSSRSFSTPSRSSGNSSSSRSSSSGGRSSSGGGRR